MLTTTYSTQTLGLDPIKITVEVDSMQGTPNLIIIGLPSKAIDESRERITASLINCGISPKAKRTIVNLAPADVRKSGSSLDLAICVGLLKLYNSIPNTTQPTTAFFGELSLDGSVKGIQGALPLVVSAQKLGFTHAVVPKQNVPELSIVKGIEVSGVSHLQDLITAYSQDIPLPCIPSSPFHPRNTTAHHDFAHIIGQETAKRAVTIGAGGNHNMLLVGPPGSGKSMLAQAMCGILPPLDETEALEITMLHSLAGLTQNSGVITHRPFRALHHTSSQVSLVGGSALLKPGEISLAHRGVLFMDEFPEFSRATIEALRQPLENGTITISRATGTVAYPANCTLIAAANPCPCGYHNTGVMPCRCSIPDRMKYQEKISGPILDRIDLQVLVPPVSIDDLRKKTTEAHSSGHIQQHVTVTREIQKYRSDLIRGSSTSQASYILNANLTSSDIKKHCCLSPQAEELLRLASQSLHLSARSYFGTIKVAQTICDLEQASYYSSLPSKADIDVLLPIEEHHIAEALQYRGNIFTGE